MRIPRWLGATGIAVGALALFAGVGFGAAAASTASTRPVVHAVSAGVAAPAKKHHGANPTWAGPVTYTVPTGTTNLFFHYSCPSSKFPIALSGAFHYLTQPGPALDMSAPRTDLGAKLQYSQWGWVFIWPSPGSPAGFQIQFNVFCVVK
jgi:hypothetical protein